MNLTYTALFEQAADGGWAAHVPDLPTILVSADTREEAEVLVREAIEIYLEESKERGMAVPQPQISAANIEVAA